MSATETCDLAASRQRLLAYADKLDRFKERYHYLGGSRPDTHAAARNATAKRMWFDQLVSDIRAVCGDVP